MMSSPYPENACTTFFSWITGIVVLSLVGTCFAGNGSGYLIVSANDESVVYRDNRMVFLDEPGAGNLTVLDFKSFPPSARTIKNVPVTVIGPPTCVALVPGRELAIVTSAMVTRKVDGVYRHEVDARVALVDLRGSGRVIDLFETGLQPSGVTVTPDGKAAWLANRAEGTVSVMMIRGEKLIEEARIEVAGPADSLSHVEISPNGKYGVATLTEGGQILVFRVQEDGIPGVIARLDCGGKPYAARFLPDGSGFFVADIERDRVAYYRFDAGDVKLEIEFAVGRIPEGIDIRPDGGWIAVSCFDGGNLTDESHARFGEPSRIYFLRKHEGCFVPAGNVEIEGTPQFAVFSGDGQYIAVSNTGKQKLSFLRRSGGGFVPTENTHSLPGEPVAAIGSR